MKRTIATLLIAVPLSIGTVTLTAGVASADVNDQIILPKPADPDPKGPGEFTDAPKPKGPQGPKDKAPAPKPKGPQDKAPVPAPKPQPKPQSQPKAQPEPKAAAENDRPAEQTMWTAASLREKNFLPQVEIAADDVANDEQGMDLSWLLIGGALVTASGAAFAGRRIARNRI